MKKAKKARAPDLGDLTKINFQVQRQLAKQFKEFCKSRGLHQRTILESLMLLVMVLPGRLRGELLDALAVWREDGELKALPAHLKGVLRPLGRLGQDDLPADVPLPTAPHVVSLLQLPPRSHYPQPTSTTPPSRL